MGSNILPLGLKCQVRREDLWKLLCKDSWAIPEGLGSLSMPVHLCPLSCACGGCGFVQGSAGALASPGNELLPSHSSARPGLATGVPRLECPWDGPALSTSFSLQRWFELGFVGVNIPAGILQEQNEGGAPAALLLL